LNARSRTYFVLCDNGNCADSFKRTLIQQVAYALLLQASRNRISIAQGRVFGLSSSRRRPINLYPKANRYETMGTSMLLTDCLQ
jgi:hypothetical protein